MKIGQLSFVQLSEPAEKPYGSGRLGSKYQGQRGPTPSRYWKNFVDEAYVVRFLSGLHVRLYRLTGGRSSAAWAKRRSCCSRPRGAEAARPARHLFSISGTAVHTRSSRRSAAARRTRPGI